MLPEVRGQTLPFLVMILYSTSHTDAFCHPFAQQSMLCLLRIISSLIAVRDQYPFRLYIINLYNAHGFFFCNSPQNESCDDVSEDDLQNRKETVNETEDVRRMHQ